MIILVMLLLKAVVEDKEVVLVDLVGQTSQISLKIFLEILVEEVDPAVGEVLAIEVQI
jgi:hypothetical protein